MVAWRGGQRPLTRSGIGDTESPAHLAMQLFCRASASGPWLSTATSSGTAEPSAPHSLGGLSIGA